MITPRFVKRIVFIVIVLVFYGQAVHADIRVISKDSESAMSKEGDTVWTCRHAGTRYVLETDAQGKVTFEQDSKVIAQGTFKGDKLSVSTETGGLYAYFKFSPEKIKFSPDNPESLWEFKIKGDKIKVVYGGSDYGKVKYYPETQKIKAKNMSGNTEAEFKGINAMSAAPCAYLVTGLDAEKRIFLALILLSMGK